MDTSPNARALLGDVLALDAQDEMLPIELLTSMHREQLRLPLRRLARLSETSTRREVLKTLNWRYPTLAGGGCFEDFSVERLIRDMGGVDVEVLEGYESIETIGSETMELLLTATDDWQVYEPLTVLYNLSLSVEMARRWLPVLEAELRISHQVGDMIFDMSQDDFEERACFEVAATV